MKHMKTSLAAIAMCILFFTACDIERNPYDSLSADEITKDPVKSTASLVNGCYAQLKAWSDPMHRCGEYAGDNIVIRGRSTDSFYEFISYSRTPNNGRLQQFWDTSYKAIAQTSNIFKMIKEGESPEIDNLLGECYFIRGLAYFYLCRAYGKPYYQSPETSLGVPVVNGTPEGDLTAIHLPDRSPVNATYEQAIADLKKAEKMLTQDKGPAYASKEAAQALLSRIYLYMSGTYTASNVQNAKLAIEYADKVIGSTKYELLPREEFMKYNTFTPENNKESIFVVKRLASEYTGYDHYYGIGGMYSNIGGMGWGEMYASATYLALLDETGRNDWYNHKIVDARAAFIEPQYLTEKKEVFRFIKNVYDTKKALVNFNYVQAPINNTSSTLSCTETLNDVPTTYPLTTVNAAQRTYSIKYSDGNTYTGVIDQQIELNRVYPMFYIVKCSREGENSQLHSPVISRLGEIYLNRAEAKAKLGKYSEALTDLNKIRTRSLPNAAYNELTVSNAEERIDKERQLELAFQAERSYDVYRNGRELTRRYPGPHDPIEVIKPTDYRVVYFIPQTAINSYPGTLTQNPTSN